MVTPKTYDFKTTKPQILRLKRTKLQKLIIKNHKTAKNLRPQKHETPNTLKNTNLQINVALNPKSIALHSQKHNTST